ncbi:hypothetical protein GDO86_006799 [Hymenochirus boettgeri]|uniref:folate gamma-glutamyl hydrolase n=1 Tax=Hymenochirus boettgeri TaxID=247094 RepID=A0A8T2JC83_9PIPI|nr:hypothetical protein GDO86_006799 [Hymenochirus boettgeri]
MRPIIGIVVQQVTDKELLPFGNTFIADTYVKFLESAGCRVVPIRLNLPEEEYVKLFQSINGVLFPGGAVDLQTSSFARTARIFYKLAIESTASGHYFPIWGTCMGFQLLTALTPGMNLLSSTPSYNVSLPLNLTSHASSSKMFCNAPPGLLQVLSQEQVTANFHRFGITTQTFQANEKLNDFYHILSTNRDDNGVEFVSTMEARNYPIYGVQWHPEVIFFKRSSDYAFLHSPSAVWISQYFADFFVNEARKSQNHFVSVEEEEAALIHNWTPKYIANISKYEQAYFF